MSSLKESEFHHRIEIVTKKATIHSHPLRFTLLCYFTVLTVDIFVSQRRNSLNHINFASCARKENHSRKIIFIRRKVLFNFQQNVNSLAT